MKTLIDIISGFEISFVNNAFCLAFEEKEDRLLLNVIIRVYFFLKFSKNTNHFQFVSILSKVSKMLDQLPYDVIEKIFSYLNLNDLIRLSLTNKKFKYFFNCIAENPNHLRFKKLFTFIGNKCNPNNTQFSYPDSIEFKSFKFLKSTRFRELFRNLEVLAIYSQPTKKNTSIELDINFQEWFDCFENLQYLEFSHPFMFFNPLQNKSLKEFKNELKLTFKDHIDDYSNYLTISNGKEASFLIKKDKIKCFKVSRGYRQYIKIKNVDYLYLKKCLNEFNLSRYFVLFDSLKALRLECIGIKNDLKRIFDKQAENESKFNSTFIVLLKNQLITSDILNLSLLKGVQCNLLCMGIQLIVESSILEFVSYARRFEILYDYVILLNYKSHLLSERDLIRLVNLRVLYISKKSLSKYEIKIINSSFQNIKDLQIVNCKIEQFFYDSIESKFPHLELLSITNCPIDNFNFLNKLESLKKVVINKSIVNHVS